MGDNVTTDRTPQFIGTTTAGQHRRAVRQRPARRPGHGDRLGHHQHRRQRAGYNFSIQLPYALTDGQTSLYVEVINPAGNTSAASNSRGPGDRLDRGRLQRRPRRRPGRYSPATRRATSSSGWSRPRRVRPPLVRRRRHLYTPSSLHRRADRRIGGRDRHRQHRRAGRRRQRHRHRHPGRGDDPGHQQLDLDHALGGGDGRRVAGPGRHRARQQVVPFEGDFDGDGVTDLAYYNLATATWTLFESSTSAVQGATTFSMGTPNSSLPVVGHFDANGPSEEAVFTVNAQGQGVWTIASALSGIRTLIFGQAGDIPVAGDFDAIGYDEPAVYRPSTGQFLVDNPVTGHVETFTIPGIGSSPGPRQPRPGPRGSTITWPTTIPASPTNSPPISGRTEPAVFDTKTGVFTILGPNGVYTVSGFQPGDIPAPADYLGIGSDQVVAYRPGTGQFIEGSAGGH